MSLEQSQSIQSNGNHVTRAVQPIRRRVADRWVKEAAYFIWEKNGRVHGRDLDCWLRAENDVRRLVDAGKIRGQSE
ncbi:MAG: DUF2934 domain-containing protein [Planctomycetaceae bacterium]|nr:DUF2934 domain-containing protein [Planctomycetaceae bacterium]